MTNKQHRIQALIHSIIAYLQDHGVGVYGVNLTLDKLKGMDLSDEKPIDLPPQGTRHDEVLTQLGYFQVIAEPVSTCVQEIFEFFPLHAPRFVTKL